MKTTHQHTKSKKHSTQPFFAAQPKIQRERKKESKNPIGDKIAEQVEDKAFKKHIIALGKEVQKLALEATDPPSNGGVPTDPQARLSALHIQYLFEQSAGDILRDPELKAFREKFAASMKGSPEAALGVALVGIVGVYLANVDVKTPDLKYKFGKSGFSVGGSLDMGKAQDLKFKKGEVYAKFTKKLIGLKAEGKLKKEEATGGAPTEPQLVEVGKGEVKVGKKQVSTTAALEADTEGKLVVTSKFSADVFGDKHRSLRLTTDFTLPTHDPSRLTVTPSVSGKFNLGRGRSLTLGTAATFSPQGFENLNGYVEYRQNRMRIRFDANTNAIPRDRSLMPGQGANLQGTFALEF